MVTDQSQAIVWQTEQTPFGEVSQTTGTLAQPLRFPGQYADPETGYSYNYFRDYDPSVGRYVQSDPIGLAGGINTYGYVEQNPLSFFDPLRLERNQVCVAACTAAGSVAGGYLGTVGGGALGGALGGLGGSVIGPGGTVAGGAAGAAAGSRAGGAAGSAAGGAAGNVAGNAFCPEDDEGDDCDALNATDTSTCNGIKRVRGARAGAACHASASERYGACLAGRPIPPLNTWNN